MKFLKSILLLCLVISFTSLKAQIHIINGDTTTCSGDFQDDGMGGTGYSPNNSYTFTICPGTPGDVIQLNFVAFHLYTSPNPNNSDYLQIFDGPDASSPSLGSYTGTDLQNHQVTATVNNPTGCLTFVFNPNPNGNINGDYPGWEALISCTTPCDPPTQESVITDPQPLVDSTQTVGVCLNEPVTFSGANSHAAPGFTLAQYKWDFADGTVDSTSGSTVSHSFTDPGEHLVNLTVIDNNGCNSLNSTPLQVLVSTIPIFHTQFDNPVCIGTQADINGNPIQSVTWTALPPQVVSGQTYLADGAGFSYSSTLNFDFFAPGQTLTNCSDLQQVFVNIEHSFLGDLSMTISCPDGTTVSLLDFPNSGGGTYLGEAVDDYQPGGGGDDTCSCNNTPGTGWTYGWSPTATNGNLDQNTNNPVTFVDNVGVLHTNQNIVPAGVYQPQGNLCDLVGCPLNGQWTFSVTDHQAIDNGYIFDWGIDFNPALFPDVTTFTPIIGLGPDSTYWQGPNIVNTSANGNLITIAPTDTGMYNYTFYATNNFGCTFDTTITVHAIDGPDITTPSTLYVCQDSVQMSAYVAGQPAPQCSQESGVHTYCYTDGQTITETFCPDVSDGSTFMTITVNQGYAEPFWDTFSVYNGSTATPANQIGNSVDGNLEGLYFHSTDPSGCITFQFQPTGFNDCATGSAGPLVITVGCTNTTQDLTYSWTPSTGLSNPNIANPLAFVTQSTTYTVSAFPSGIPGCAKQAQLTVAPNPQADPGINNEITICYNTPTFALRDSLLGNPATGGTWIDTTTSGNVSANFDPSQHPNGGDFYFQYTVSNGQCENSSFLTIHELPAGDPSCCQTNAVAGPDSILCALSMNLQAQNALGIGQWTGPPAVTFANAYDPHTQVSAPSPGGSYKLYWTDNNGYLCSAKDSVTLVFSDPMQVQAFGIPPSCQDSCDGKATVVASGGIISQDYQYSWSSGVMNAIPESRESLCPGSYYVVATDDYGCSDSAFFSINNPPAMTAHVTAQQPSCHGACDGILTVQSPNAVSYSYDGGQTYKSSPIDSVCPGNYDIVVRNENGCPGFATAFVPNPEQVHANFTMTPNPTTTKHTQIDFSNLSGPQPISQAYWIFDTLNTIGTSSDWNPSFLFPSDTSGTYSVFLRVTNPFGCSDSLVQNLVIMPELQVFIPNAFSPNGDGRNDIWKPILNTQDYSEYHLQVMNRWGQIIFETTNPDLGWNGSTNNGDYFVAPGVYLYRIKVVSATDNEKHELTGHITVVR